MDGVIVDFIQSVINHPDYDKNNSEIDGLKDVFLNAPPIDLAID